MNSTVTKSMFESIKKKLTESSGESIFKDFLKLEVGNTYQVRLLPNVKNPDETFFHYYSHGWESFSTGKFISAVSPSTFGDRDPISEASLAARKKGTEEEKEKAKALNRKENWLVNVYVVNDPKTPENNGTVKILRYGRQLHKIIMDAIEGEDSADFGERIFDLSPNGCTLKIKVEKNQGGYPTYVSSRFSNPTDLNLNDAQQSKIYNSCFELSKVYTVKSYEELKEMLDVHYFGKEVKKDTKVSNKKVVQNEVTNTTPDAPLDPDDAATAADAMIDDAEVQELLKNL